MLRARPIVVPPLRFKMSCEKNRKPGGHIEANNFSTTIIDSNRQPLDCLVALEVTLFHNASFLAERIFRVGDSCNYFICNSAIVEIINSNLREAIKGVGQVGILKNISNTNQTV